MRLTPKLLSFCVPILIATLSAMGFWSYFIAQKATHQHELNLLEILSEQVTANKIQVKVDLLFKAGLSGVESFENSFKEEVFEELERLSQDTKKSFHIIDCNLKELVFSTGQSSPEFNQALLSVKLDGSRTQRSGSYQSLDGERLYSGFHYDYWHWDVFVTESVDVISAPIARIRIIAFMSTLLGTLLIAFLLWWVLHKLIINNIRVLGRAATEISKTGKAVSVPITSRDELRDLADEVESMSQEIESSITKAEAANRAKSAFLATMSHEIRTPLNGMVGMANILRNTQLDDKQQEMVAALITSSKTLSSVISDVLDLSKIESGKLIIETTELVPSELINSVKVVFEGLAIDNDSSLECESHIDPNLVLFTDIVRVRQILFNIVGNAVKFTQSGNICVDMRLDKQGTQNFLHIECRDTGIGIDENRLEAIFEAFTQSDSSTTRNFGGSGLGLSIVKQLLNLLGGNISVQSSAGEGSQFFIDVPVAVKTAQSASNNTALSSKAIETKGLKVLLVEDNEINRMVAQSFLEQYGFFVISAVDGQQAVNAVEKHNFDLILMDIHMPVMDGIKATKLIKQMPSPKSDIPILGLTAEAFDERHKEFIAVGMDDVITKPIDDTLMITKIRNTLSKVKSL